MAVPDFHATRWTLVSRAQGRGEEARVALSELCAIYYEPVLQFARRWCGDADRARDLAHGFFAELIARESLGAADPAKGRFRNYLLAAVKHFLCRQRERDAALKRGGDVETMPMDEAPEEGVVPEWEREFDRAWAVAIIRHALERLEKEMSEAGKAERFRILQPWLDGGAAGPPGEASEALGLSPNAFKVTVHRLRQRFRTMVREEVAATATSPGDADDEFRHLVTVLAGE